MMDLCRLFPLPTDVWGPHIYNGIGLFAGIAVGTYWLFWQSSSTRWNIKLKAILGTSVYLQATGAITGALGGWIGQIFALLLKAPCSE
jgi:hypothetical protein